MHGSTIRSAILVGIAGVVVAAASIAPATAAPHASRSSNVRIMPNMVPITTAINNGVTRGMVSSVRNRTVPFFSNSFSYHGTSYPYQMVGTDPRHGGGTTTVPTVLTPLRFVFADGTVFDGTPDVSATVASPIFTPAKFSSGHTQYGSAIMRAEFYKYAKGSAYDVLLGAPQIAPTVTIHVPASEGGVYQGSGGTPFGGIKYFWFNKAVKPLFMDARPTELPLLLSHDVLLYFGHVTPNRCCVIGYHGATFKTQNLQTYSWASWTDPGIFPPSTHITDTAVLSHEVSEWLNDPFVDNVVPAWSVPSAPQYGCSNYLETGDPLVGTAFHVNGYALQDEAFYSWFARQKPSIGIHGWYSYLGTFRHPSPSC